MAAGMLLALTVINVGAVMLTASTFSALFMITTFINVALALALRQMLSWGRILTLARCLLGIALADHAGREPGRGPGRYRDDLAAGRHRPADPGAAAQGEVVGRRRPVYFGRRRHGDRSDVFAGRCGLTSNL